MGECLPLAVNVVLVVLFGGIAYIATVLHNRRVATATAERGKPFRSGIFVTQRQAMYLIQHSEAFPRSARMLADEEAREHEAFRMMLLFEKECPKARMKSFYNEAELEAWLARMASRKGGDQ